MLTSSADSKDYNSKEAISLRKKCFSQQIENMSGYGQREKLLKDFIELSPKECHQDYYNIYHLQYLKDFEKETNILNG